VYEHDAGKPARVLQPLEMPFPKVRARAEAEILPLLMLFSFIVSGFMSGSGAYLGGKGGDFPNS